MATITSLGFSIFSTYSGRGVTAARRDVNDLTNDLERNKAKLNEAAAGFFSLGNAAAALGPSLLPIGAAAATGAASFGAMAVAAGVGLGVVGVSIKSAIKSADNLTVNLAHMTAAQRAFTIAQTDAGAAYAKFLKVTESKSLGIATDAYRGLAVIVKQLVPTYNAFYPVVKKVSVAFEEWAKSPAAANYFNLIRAVGVPALNNLMSAGRAMLRVLGDAFRALVPTVVPLSRAINEGAQNLKKWADNGGFANFLQKVHDNAPAVREFFTNLGQALKNIGSAMAGLGSPSLTLANILLKIVAAMPPSWIQAIVVGFVAFRTVMLTMAIISVVSSAIGILQLVLVTLNFVLVALGITWNVFFGWLTIIIIGVAALVVGIIFLVQNWTTVWNAIKQTALTVWNFLTHGLGMLVLALMGPLGILIILGTHWRDIWNGMKIVGEAVWNAMKVAWNAVVNGFVVAWNVVSAALRATWNTLWNGLKVFGESVWNAMKTAWNAVGNAFRTVMSTLNSALTTTWHTLWNGLKAFGEGVWNALKAAWNALSNAFRATMSTLNSALTTTWHALWNGLKAFGQTIWNAMKAAWNAFSSGMRTIMSALNTAMTTTWRTLWNGIKKIAQDIWNGLRKAFDTFKSGLESATKALMKAMATAWDGGAKAVGKAWALIKKLVRDPIEAVVNVVYNKGIVKLWNTVAGVFGAPHLTDFHLPPFRDGGAVSGPGTGTSDSIVARLSNNEHVVTAAEVQAAGGHQAVARQRAQWLNGGGNHHVRTMGSASNPYFALGGGIHIPGTNIDIPNPLDAAKVAFNAVSGFGGDVLDKLKKLALGAIAGVVNPLIQKAADVGKGAVRDIIPGKPWLETLIAGGPGGVVSSGGSNPQDSAASGSHAQGAVPTNGGGLIQKVADMIKSWITAHDIAPGGANVADAQKWADAQVGKPYSLGSFGASFDCSSFMSGIAQIILGNKPSPLFTTFAFTGAKQGPATFEKDLTAPFMVGVENRGIGHMAGTINGKNYEATPPAVRSGPSARGAHDAMFDMVYGMKASIGGGGVIPSGQHLAIIDAALKAAGVPPPGTQAQWEAGLNTLIGRESGWNSGAVNNTDSNAAAGHPSKGLAQVIQPTFDAFHVAGTSSNILDPIANVAAAIRYIVATYGNITNVQQANASLPPKGYRRGTDRARKGWHMIDEDGGEWINFRGGEEVLPHGRHPRPAQDQAPVTVHVENHWHGNPTKEAVQYAEGGMADKLRQACVAGVGGRAH